MNQPSSIYACPVCTLALDRVERQYRCTRGHSFDVSREGYVNLLLPNQRRSPEPGDSPDMVRNRRAFLERGHYAPLAHRIGNVVADISGSAGPDRADLLDAGCGEGYFLRQVRQACPTSAPALWGIDISRTAIRYAAKMSPDIGYAVASVHRLPIRSGSVATLLSILAPRDYEEWSRVVPPSGVAVVVVPSSRHLYGLRQLVYRQPMLHETESKLSGEPWFRPLREESVRFELCLDRADIVRLVSMTPYLWHLDAEAQRNLDQLPELRTDVEFVIGLVERRD